MLLKQQVLHQSVLRRNIYLTKTLWSVAYPYIAIIIRFTPIQSGSIS